VYSVGRPIRGGDVEPADREGKEREGESEEISIT